MNGGLNLKTTDRRSSTALLMEVNPQAMADYRQMRAKVMPAPGVDAATCEIVLAMQLALLGHEVPFKIHAMRAMRLGIALHQMEALLLASVGVSMVVGDAARALNWLREASEELRANQSAAIDGPLSGNSSTNA